MAPERGLLRGVLLRARRSGAIRSSVCSAGRDRLWDSVGPACPSTFPTSSQWLLSHGAVGVGEPKTSEGF